MSFDGQSPFGFSTLVAICPNAHEVMLQLFGDAPSVEIVDLPIDNRCPHCESILSVRNGRYVRDGQGRLSLSSPPTTEP